MEKIHCVPKVQLLVKTSLFVLFNATAEFVNFSLLKNLETHFCYVTCKKNFIKRIKNLLQHLSEKFIDDNSLIADIALKNWDLSISGIAKGFSEVIVIIASVPVQKGLSRPSLSISVYEVLSELAKLPL